jgi:hypothetical protein
MRFWEDGEGDGTGVKTGARAGTVVPVPVATTDGLEDTSPEGSRDGLERGAGTGASIIPEGSRLMLFLAGMIDYTRGQFIFSFFLLGVFLEPLPLLLLPRENKSIRLASKKCENISGQKDINEKCLSFLATVQVLYSTPHST